jgi:hypothetical protein
MIWPQFANKDSFFSTYELSQYIANLEHDCMQVVRYSPNIYSSNNLIVES